MQLSTGAVSSPPSFPIVKSQDNPPPHAPKLPLKDLNLGYGGGGGKTMDPFQQQTQQQEVGADGSSNHASPAAAADNSGGLAFATFKRQASQDDANADGGSPDRDPKRIRGNQGFQGNEGTLSSSSHEDALERLRQMQAPGNMPLDPTAAAFANNHNQQLMSMSQNQMGLNPSSSPQNSSQLLPQQQQQQLMGGAAGQLALASGSAGPGNNLTSELTAQILRQEQARRNAAIITALGMNPYGGTGGQSGSSNNNNNISQGATSSLSTLWPAPIGGGMDQQGPNLQDQSQYQQQDPAARLAAATTAPGPGLISLNQGTGTPSALEQLASGAIAPGPPGLVSLPFNQGVAPSALEQLASGSVSTTNPTPFGGLTNTLQQARQQQLFSGGVAGLGGGSNNLNNNSSDLAAMIQQLQRQSSGAAPTAGGVNNHSAAAAGLSPMLGSLDSLVQGSGGGMNMNSLMMGSNPTAASAAAVTGGNFRVPPCNDGGSPLQPHNAREKYPLGIDEDPNWLSEFHCFVRCELVEVYRASREDVKSRNNAICHQQVGIRCRFCAHKASSARAGRSSAFPSSLRQIYQSFTMMLRDHFSNCESIPPQVLERFQTLKDKPAQGATDSKRYWVYSAMKLGMTDSPEGIMINERTVATGASLPPFGTIQGEAWPDDAHKNVALIIPSDRPLVSDFIYTLMQQVTIVHLTDAERIGNRRSLAAGLPGFSCKYCYDRRRLGLCRMFPARRRTLPSKMVDIYDHLRRCTVTPQSVKDQLENLQHQATDDAFVDRDDMKEFFDRLWDRLGHGSSSSGARHGAF